MAQTKQFPPNYFRDGWDRLAELKPKPPKRPPLSKSSSGKKK